MTGKRPRLYPSHQHQWAPICPTCGDQLVPDGTAPGEWMHGTLTDHPATPGLVRCTICTFTVPRNLANLDGLPARPVDPIEMGFGPTETDIEEFVARANRKHQPVTEWVPLGVASDEVTEETTTETEWGTETHRTYADGGSSLSVDVPGTST